MFQENWENGNTPREKFEEDMMMSGKKVGFENVHPFLPNFFIKVRHATNFKVKTSSLTTKIFFCIVQVVRVLGSSGF